MEFVAFLCLTINYLGMPVLQTKKTWKNSDEANDHNIEKRSFNHSIFLGGKHLSFLPFLFFPNLFIVLLNCLWRGWRRFGEIAKFVG